jgi:hypothetical protein
MQTRRFTGGTDDRIRPGRRLVACFPDPGRDENTGGVKINNGDPLPDEFFHRGVGNYEFFLLRPLGSERAFFIFSFGSRFDPSLLPKERDIAPAVDIPIREGGEKHSGIDLGGIPL